MMDCILKKSDFEIMVLLASLYMSQNDYPVDSKGMQVMDQVKNLIPRRIKKIILKRIEIEERLKGSITLTQHTLRLLLTKGDSK